MNPETHKRYLEYRERHEYFGSTAPVLPREPFLAADEEHRLLEAKGEDARDDEEEARWVELSKLLFREILLRRRRRSRQSEAGPYVELGWHYRREIDVHPLLSGHYHAAVRTGTAPLV